MHRFTICVLLAFLCDVTRAQPPELPKADELVALPAESGGGWLALRKTSVLLLDAQGTVTAQWPVRAQLLDARFEAAAGFAVVLDANAERVVPLRIDSARRTITALPALPAPSESVVALCLYRDAQAQQHVFVVGKSGIAEQWVMRGDEALPVRRLAVAPQAESCRVDDRQARLYVSEPGGVWSHRARAEGSPTREAVALRRPLGPLAQGGGPIAVLPSGGVAVADPGRARVLLLARTGQEGKRRSVWRTDRELTLPAGSEPDQLLTVAQTAGARLAVHDDANGRWAWQALPATTAGAAYSDHAELPNVLPRAQSAPVAQQGDAADDPAIWVHPRDAARSLVLATDKKRGLAVYDLQGRERQFLPVGRVNNVDVRQDVLLSADGGRNERADIAVATQRDDNSVVVFRIDAQGAVSEWARLPTGFEDAYGICLHRAPTGAAEVFVNDKSGRVLQLRIGLRDGVPVGTRLREFKLASQPEGCVADDRAQRLFVGEEKRGVWSASAVADAALDLRLVLPVGGVLTADVEGMGLYRGAQASYLVVSSQGNDSFVVIDAAPPHRVRGAFRIGMNLAAGIDGVSETDGLEVLSGTFGPDYPQGLLVAQDGHKRLPDGPQNFKLVSWEDVARALKLP